MTTRRTRRWIYALGPALAIIALAEVGARLVMSDGPLAEVRRSLYARLDRDAALMHESLYELHARDLFVPDEYAGYRLRDATDPASRQPPYLPPKPKEPNEIRVVCVGDSVTFGRSLEDSWPGRLQRLLDADAPYSIRFVVFNAGTPGHNVVQCKRMLQHRWMALEPDVVIWHESARFAERPEPAPPMNVRQFTWLSRAYRARSLYLLLAARQAWATRDEPDAPSRYDAPGASEGDARAVIELARWCVDRGVHRFLLVDYLTQDEQGIARGHGGFVEASAHAGEAGGSFDAVPLLNAFRAHPGGAAALFTDRIHLTGEGMDLIARAVHDNITSRFSRERALSEPAR
ncbi:MAG: SGNH/GDSL hydrolase family protein [Deltaproteobacteria bacterium]|nr:SGNH/GDSL hydrolase family protein [Deltaproteobacteria bacterium]